MEVALVKGRSNYVCQYKLGGGYPDDDEGTLFSPRRGRRPRGPRPPRTGRALGQEVVRLREWAEETETGDRDELVPGVSDRAWRQVSVQRHGLPGRPAAARWRPSASASWPAPTPPTRTW